MITRGAVMRAEQTGMVRVKSWAGSIPVTASGTIPIHGPQEWAVTIGGINMLYCTTEEEAKKAWAALNATIENLVKFEERVREELAK